MNILIAVFSFPPETNGVSHVAHAHAIGFSQKGHKVTVATGLNNKRNLFELERQGIKVFQFNVKGSGNIRVGYSGEIEKYQRFIAKFDADLMLFHCWQIWTTDLAIPVFPSIRAKKILVSHGVSANSILTPRNVVNWICWRPYIWKMRNMLKAFDHVVFLSYRADKNRFYDHYLVKKMGLYNYSIIPNGTYPLDYSVRNIDFKKKYNICTKYMILHVANYDIMKNQKMVIESFYKSGIKNATSVFIGSEKNSYSDKLEKYARKIGIKDNILFLEKLSREDILSAYISADLFICSSLLEAQPLIILDAMRAGVPFISTNVGCIGELPGGVVAKNTNEMAERISFLLNNPAIRSRLAEEGKKACEQKYSWDLIIDEYERLFAKLLAKETNQNLPASNIELTII